MTAANKISRIYYTYVVSDKISGKLKVGGIIGDVETTLYMPENFYYGNYVQANIESDDNATISLGIGGSSTQNQYLKDTYYYKYSKVNGENPNIENEMFILEDKYLTETQLKQQTTYTSKLKWITSDWKFNVLQNEKYPIINVEYLEEQEGIDLPKDEDNIVTESNNSENLHENEINKISENENLEQSFEYNEKKIKTYSTYSIITSAD